MGTTPSFNLNPEGNTFRPPGMPTPGNFDLGSNSPSFSFTSPFPTNPAPPSPTPQIPVNTNPSAGGSTTPYTTTVGGGYQAGSTLNPQFTGDLTNFLTQSLLSGGANPYTGQLSADPNQNPLLTQLAQLLQGQGSSLPGAGNLQNIASGLGPGVLNQLASGMGLGSTSALAGGQGFGSLNQLATGGGPGSGPLNQLSQTGNPIDQTPAWQAMVDAMQRQISQGATNLKEQFNFEGGLAGTPFANSIQDYYTQSNKDLNAQLLGAQTGALENAANRQLGASSTLAGNALSGSDILSQLGLGGSSLLTNSALNSALGLGNLSTNTGMGLLNAGGNLGQYSQGLTQNALGLQYQDWLRQQAQYNPLLPMMQQLGTTFSPYLNTNQPESPLNALIGALPGLIGAVRPPQLNFSPTVNAQGGTAQGGQGGAGGTATAQGGAGGTATASPTVSPTISQAPTIDPSMNPTFQNVPSFNVSPSFTNSPNISSLSNLDSAINPSINQIPTISPSFNPTISPNFSPGFSANYNQNYNPSNITAPNISPNISPTMQNILNGILSGAGGVPPAPPVGALPTGGLGPSFPQLPPGAPPTNTSTGGTVYPIGGAPSMGGSGNPIGVSPFPTDASGNPLPIQLPPGFPPDVWPNPPQAGGAPDYSTGTTTQPIDPGLIPYQPYIAPGGGTLPVGTGPDGTLTPSDLSNLGVDFSSLGAPDMFGGGGGGGGMGNWPDYALEA